VVPSTWSGSSRRRSAPEPRSSKKHWESGGGGALAAAAPGGAAVLLVCPPGHRGGIPCPHQNGVPAGAQRSGSGGERRRSGVREFSAPWGRKRGIRSLRRRGAGRGGSDAGRASDQGGIFCSLLWRRQPPAGQRGSAGLCRALHPLRRGERKRQAVRHPAVPDGRLRRPDRRWLHPH
jgi:hypothetical protein